MPQRTISTRARPRLLAGLAAGVAPAVVRQASARAADQPDIIVLLMNDVRNGDQVALPKTMERLAGGGTTFPNFFLATPLCCPSRATLFTGLYPHNHGVYDNKDGKHGGLKGFTRRNRGRTTGVFLQGAGYRTAAIGNYLNWKRPKRGAEPGWDNGPRAKDEPLGDDQIIAAAAEELTTTPASQPLYIHAGLGVGHAPATPSPAYAGRFAGAAVARDESFNREDMSGKPRYMRELKRLSPRDEAWLDTLHQGRLECLLEFDDLLGTLWGALEARGRLDNTYIFLLTDNGFLLGQHRYSSKSVPYDGSVRCPLVAFGPGFAPGVVDERLVSNIDMAPTLLDVAGAAPQPMDGVSLLSGHDRDAVLLELLSPRVRSMPWPGPRTTVTRYYAARTAQHLYVEYRTGERELYDYARDPLELDNLLAGTPTPDAEAIAAPLAARLAQLRG